MCAGSTLLLTPVVRPAKVSQQQPSEVFSSSYWPIQPWFRTEGIPIAVLIKPSSWGLPTRKQQDLFWRRCRGGRGFLQGESLTSNLLTLFLFCLVYFILSCLFLYIKNAKIK